MENQDATGLDSGGGPPIEDVARDGATPVPQASVDPALVRALGGTLAVVATLLARANIVPVGELGQLLGIFATVSMEDDPGAGKIVAAWGAMLLDVHEDLQGVFDGPR